MTKRVYRICLLLAIIVFSCIGVVYYVNHKEEMKQKEDAVLVQYVMPKAEHGGLVA
ncbi:MAG: hypothetical protein UHU19_02250 [Lachnospiraceae bacterium]|nr:hypothetical protein [Lachnospiraceae bacterium]